MANGSPPETISAWRQRAVERSLGEARAEALSRSDQFLAAAMSLLDETGRIDFTVQDILDRSNLSLRAFYKFFGGKDELLLALFEELLVAFVAELRQEVEAVDHPIDRLRAYVDGFYRRAQTAPAGGARALALYQLRMADGRADQMAGALTPQIELMHEIIELGVASGDFRRDLAPEVLTHLMTVTLSSVVQMSVLGVHLDDQEVGPPDLWSWCWQAVADPAVHASTDGNGNGKRKPTTKPRKAPAKRK